MLLKMVISTYFKGEVVIKVVFHHYVQEQLPVFHMQKWYNCMLLKVIKML